jgi:hypothetical protein
MVSRLTARFAPGKVARVSFWLHCFLVVLLAVAPVLSSAAYAAASDADAPCPMTASENAGHSPCGDCGDPASSCAQVCAMLGAGMLLSPDRAPSVCDFPAQRVAAFASDVFRSHAGPPGLQPPR